MGRRGQKKRSDQDCSRPEGQKHRDRQPLEWGVSLVKSFIKNNGLDPENDVTMIATGVGTQALLALQSGQVQALMYWSSALVGFQSMDSDLKILKDPTWADMPDYSLATSQQVIDKKPEMVEGVSRGIVKAMVFAAANPDCARRLQWKFYPDTKPTNVDEQTATSNDLAKISYQRPEAVTH